MPQIKELPIRWDIWSAVFLSLSLFKRDKLEEVEQSLMSLYFEFAMQLQDAEFSDVLKVTNSMISSDKLIGYVNGCKVRSMNLLHVQFSHSLCFSSSFRASSP